MMSRKTPAPTLFEDAQTQVSGRKSEKYTQEAKKIAIITQGDQLKDEEIKRLKQLLVIEQKKVANQKEISKLFLRKFTKAEEVIGELLDEASNQNLRLHKLQRESNRHCFYANKSKTKTNEVLGERPMWRR